MPILLTEFEKGLVGPGKKQKGLPPTEVKNHFELLLSGTIDIAKSLYYHRHPQTNYLTSMQTWILNQGAEDETCYWTHTSTRNLADTWSPEIREIVKKHLYAYKIELETSIKKKPDENQQAHGPGWIGSLYVCEVTSLNEMCSTYIRDLYHWIPGPKIATLEPQVFLNGPLAVNVKVLQENIGPKGVNVEALKAEAAKQFKKLNPAKPPQKFNQI
jgi:hypothetical protein